MLAGFLPELFVAEGAFLNSSRFYYFSLEYWADPLLLFACTRKPFRSLKLSDQRPDRVESWNFQRRSSQEMKKLTR